MLAAVAVEAAPTPAAALPLSTPAAAGAADIPAAVTVAVMVAVMVDAITVATEVAEAAVAEERFGGGAAVVAAIMEVIGVGLMVCAPGAPTTTTATRSDGRLNGPWWREAAFSHGNKTTLNFWQACLTTSLLGSSYRLM